jgi:hypothetical protein
VWFASVFSRHVLRMWFWLATAKRLLPSKKIYDCQSF